MNLYNEYRPDQFDQVYGNEEIVNSLLSLFEADKVPHVFLFTGPSGCGKTTLARIIRTELKCSDADYLEVDSADFRGIDTIRGIRANMVYAPQQGPCRVILLDEVHQLTKDAQDALLKALEDTPEHIYFILATTNPEKLIPTVKTRCTTYEVSPLSREDMSLLLNDIASSEGGKISSEALANIIKTAKGSPRLAINALESILNLSSEEQSKAVFSADEAETRCIDLAKILVNKKATWKEVALILKTMTDDPETVRRGVMGYHSAILLNGKDNAMSFLVLEAFQDNFYDSGMAGLVRACYEVVNG